jgi:hypothetical protein
MPIGVKPYYPKPFSIAVPDATLEDLKRRLSHVRWPDEVEPGGRTESTWSISGPSSTIGATNTIGAGTKRR